ncbi:hypothetical protein [Sphaerospermopsis aphanizomenoides]|uniref:hypothetical protein n=1 Tax=Sphaerospermopsis aphanizomenoides TaxID=459663 RepID=UPI001908FC2C|nr:hypothetical protein [Sphaerospermopsis aphanizomenoides]
MARNKATAKVVRTSTDDKTYTVKAFSLESPAIKIKAVLGYLLLSLVVITRNNLGFYLSIAGGRRKSLVISTFQGLIMS